MFNFLFFVIIVIIFISLASGGPKKRKKTTIDLSGIDLQEYGESFMKSKVLMVLAVIAVIGLVVLMRSVKIVPAGTVGVYDIFGKVSETERKSGLQLVNPLANLVIMNIKTQEVTETMPVPSKEGLSINLDVSILYSLNPEMASDIYKDVGSNYRNVIVVPQFRSACRGASAGYEAKALYTSGREEIAAKISAELKTMLEDRGIILEKVLLRSIKLPTTVADAIELKLKFEQESEQMKFVLTKEMKEAERRVIEAKGIAEAQEIINRTLTPEYLQLEAIQAQKKMAESPNHTTVYIPSGDNGIPIIRGLDNN